MSARGVRSAAWIAGAAVTVLLAAACGPAAFERAAPAALRAAGGRIAAVGAESQYANVISQIGGRYVAVGAVESNPNADPHAFEASPSIAARVSAARLVVQNGLGYDTYMNGIEAAAPSSSRRIVVVAKLLGLPDSTPNPHLWYRPGAMSALARVLARDLGAIQPRHRAYFAANAARFDRSLLPWYAALRDLARAHPRTPVASTEPVGDYLLAAAGTVNLTPFSFQADIMNGVDPPPQGLALEQALLAERRVRVFLYNRQVTDSLTASFLADARSHGVPVVALYETLPAGYSYQSWMLAETRALARAITNAASTERL